MAGHWSLPVLLEQKEVQRLEGKPGHALDEGSETKLSHHPGHREGRGWLALVLLVDTM